MLIYLMKKDIGIKEQYFARHMLYGVNTCGVNAPCQLV